MFPIRKVTGVITHPARTAGAVAGATLGASVGAATAGMRTTARVVGWALGRAGGPGQAEAPSTWRPEPRPEQAPATEVTAPDEPPVKKAPSKKGAAKKAPAKKAPARKTPARKTSVKAPSKKAPSKKAAVMAPALGLTEAEVAEVTEVADELRTPSGIPAAGEGTNPDTTETDLHQPGTEPLVDPATVKAVASESEVLRRAADRDKG